MGVGSRECDSRGPFGTGCGGDRSNGSGSQAPRASQGVYGGRSEKSIHDETPKKLGNMLTGMVLFFIPNSRKNGVRKYRMNLFTQHGADVRDCWNEDITHIICDKSITGERIMRELQWEQFPVSRFEIVADH